MEEKIKLNFSEPLTEDVLYENQHIIVRKYVTPSDKAKIINDIDMALLSNDGEFSDIQESLFRNSYMIGSILNIMTNVDVDGLSIDEFVSSGLWERIKNCIVNLGELIFDYKQIYQDRKMLLSLESKVSGLVEKAGIFIDKISKIDVSKEGLGELLKAFDEQKEKLNEVYPTIQEKTVAEGGKKSKKTPKVPESTS